MVGRPAFCFRSGRAAGSRLRSEDEPVAEIVADSQPRHLPRVSNDLQHRVFLSNSYGEDVSGRAYALCSGSFKSLLQNRVVKRGDAPDALILHEHSDAEFLVRWQRLPLGTG